MATTKTIKTRLQLIGGNGLEWAGKTLLKNEIGVEWGYTVTGPDAEGNDIIQSTNELIGIKIGDGTSKWEELDYFGGEDAHVFTRLLAAEGEQHNDILPDLSAEDSEYVIGDIAIIEEEIGSDTGKYVRTAYVVDENAKAELVWKALDGNINADNVYFSEDLITTYAVGNISLTNGQGTVSAKGQNLAAVWNNIYQKETAPTITNASMASFSAGPDNEVEVGTTISTINYSGRFNEGKYSFGSKYNNTTYSADEGTHVTPTWNEITCTLNDSGNGTITNNKKENVTGTRTWDGNWSTSTGSGDKNGMYYYPISGSFTLSEPIEVNSTSSKTYATVAYKMEWTQSDYTPINNLGKEVTGAIAAQSNITGSDSVKITGYRRMFYGTFTEKKAISELTSADFRESTTITKPKAAAGTVSLSIPAQSARVVIAVPSGRSVTKVLDVNDSNSDLFAAGSFTKVENVAIHGANGFATEAYTLYYLDYATPADIVANTYTVTIA